MLKNMKIIEKSDYTLVIERQETEINWLPFLEDGIIGIYRIKDDQPYEIMQSINFKDYLWSGHTIILYFENKIPDIYNVGDEVTWFINYTLNTTGVDFDRDVKYYAGSIDTTYRI